jgi:hypothetical protein
MKEKIKVTMKEFSTPFVMIDSLKLTMVTSIYFLTHFTGYWVFLFCASKIFELSETVVKVLQGKTIDFLHYYHHWITFLFAWQSSVVFSTPGMWISFMNFFVHAWMYLYCKKKKI